MDPNNPVVQLCVEGMRAEAEGRNDDARVFFEEAWSAARDEYEWCIAAHYVARHQESDEMMLRWNETALEQAEKVGDERVRDFYPSLYLNLGRSHEALEQTERARGYYERGTEFCDALPEGSYGNVVRDGLAQGLERTAAVLGTPASRRTQ